MEGHSTSNAGPPEVPPDALTPVDIFEYLRTIIETQEGRRTHKTEHDSVFCTSWLRELCEILLYDVLQQATERQESVEQDNK